MPGGKYLALQSSVTGMTDTLERLPMVWAWDRARALAVIAEAVWQVTLVDTTLVRHHLDTYDGVMAGQAPGQRRLIEGTLAGLRFVRNHMSTKASLAEFIQADGPGPSYGGITNWIWKPVPDPELALLSAHGQAWEMTRYRAYRTHVAGHTVGETFVRAAAFLLLAAAKAQSMTVTALPASVLAARGFDFRGFVVAVTLVWGCLSLLPVPDSCRVLRAGGRVKGRAAPVQRRRRRP